MGIYEQFDQLLVRTVRGIVNRGEVAVFNAIQTELETVSSFHHLHKNSSGGLRSLIDKRLQSLRKKGLLLYSKQTKWGLAAPQSPEQSDLPIFNHPITNLIYNAAEKVDLESAYVRLKKAVSIIENHTCDWHKNNDECPPTYHVSCTGGMTLNQEGGFCPFCTGTVLLKNAG